MDIYDAWSNFIETGSVMDYLRYTSLRDSKNNFPEYYNDTEDYLQEDDDENLHRRTDNRRTEYW
ncbi:MAG: hypothetical protein U0O22_01485 [Acutalibacteraceae bacterium]